MSLDLVDLLFNAAVMLFWIRLWNPDGTALRLNPYLAGADNMTRPVMDLFRRRGHASPPAGSAVIFILALLMFRGLALPRAGADQLMQMWVLQLGFESLAPSQVALSMAATWMLFSVLSFAVFLFKVWGLAWLLLIGWRGNAQCDCAPEFLLIVSRPFSAIKPLWQPVVLLGYGLLIILSIQCARAGIETVIFAPWPTLMLRIARGGVAAIAGIVNLLLPLQSFLLILIIGSWVAMFGGGDMLLNRCQEWLDVILRPFRRFPMRLGAFDLTPIIAFAVFGLLHWILNGPWGGLRLLSIYLQGGGGLR